jgi:FixJ family two-component response regulator
MSGLSGLDLQREPKRLGVAVPAIFITGYGDIAMAVIAIQDGAADFIERPSTRNGRSRASARQWPRAGASLQSELRRGGDQSKDRRERSRLGKGTMHVSSLADLSSSARLLSARGRQRRDSQGRMDRHNHWLTNID